MRRLLTVFLVSALSSFAQQTGPVPAKIEVHAPFAQQLILKEKAMHPEIQKLGLHAVPPGQTQNVIIANNLAEKIGKVSSPNDMRLVASGTPVVVRVEQGSFFDTFVPLHDSGGTTIGFLVMEVPFATASTEQKAIQKGMSIRDEIQQQAPALDTLFGPATRQ